MVKCVVVKIEDIEDVRRELSSNNLIDREWKIEVEYQYGYIPIKDDSPVEYKTTNRDLQSRSLQKDVSEILGYEPTYEWLGDIILLEEDEKNSTNIVNAFKASKQDPKSILLKKSDIEGEIRTRDWDLLYGESTETVHREYGHEYLLDISEVYFSPRLATERNRVCSKIEDSSTVFDMFAGVGPYAIPAASNGAEVVAVDINHIAIEYLRSNLERNSVEENVTAIQGNVREVSKEYEGYANDVIMNLPHTADEFIDTAINILCDGGRIFYYDFRLESEDASSLKNELQNKMSSEASIKIVDYRSVRPYAPNVVNICAEILVRKR